MDEQSNFNELLHKYKHDGGTHSFLDGAFYMINVQKLSDRGEKQTERGKI